MASPLSIDRIVELKHERDEARAIARRLANLIQWITGEIPWPQANRADIFAFREQLMREIRADFDALPWAKDQS